MQEPRSDNPEVLHFVGYENDRGGTVSVIRALLQTGRFRGAIGVGPDFRQERTPPIQAVAFPRIAAEDLRFASIGESSRVARAARDWLRGDPGRIFHGHSRAGLLVAMRLALAGEKRVVATVHCLGRKKWFYRTAARVLGSRLYYLGPTMKAYYGAAAPGWEQCLPDCVPAAPSAKRGAPDVGHGAKMVFGLVGGLDPIKQWQLVLQGLAAIPADSGISVVHAGGTSGSAESEKYARDLKAMAVHLQVSDRIEWLGPQRDMAAFYSRIDCLIVPGRLEAGSVAALEAIAAGVPVICAAESGTRDIVEETKAGWTFEADSPAALAAVMKTLSAKRLAPSAAGLGRFMADRVAELHLEAYRRL